MKRRLTFLLLSLFLGLQCMVAQTIRVAGVVVSEEDGLPIIGASIVVKGTVTGTVTDLDGKFSLEAPRNAHLQVSYVGMKPVDVAVQPTMRIVMFTDAQALDEVMIVAYGTAKKSSFTGSAAAIGSQSIEKRPLTNAVSALEGAVSGVQVTSASGQPGSTPDIRIRGFGSINSSSAPLYVVDGAIYNGQLADINPTDIESMTVLKDAASTSLYGSSAGNGVILITTKKAKGDGQHSVNLNISQGFSARSIPEYDRINVWDYYPKQWEMLRNTFISKKDDPEKAAAKASSTIYNQLKYNPFKGIPNDQIVGIDGKLNPAATTLLYGDDLDWENAGTQTGYRQDYNLSYSSKTDKSDTYASIGYLNEKGYIIRTDNERFSGRVNYNIYPVKWFKTGLNISATRTKANVSNAVSESSSSYNNIDRFMRVVAPIYPIYKHDPQTGDYILDLKGEKIYDYDGNKISDPGRHVIAETYWNQRDNDRDVMNARTYLEFTLYEGLKATVNGTLDNDNRRNKTYENTKVGDGSPAGRLNIEQNRYTTYMFNELLTYANTIGGHSFDVLLGHENQSYTRQYTYGMRQNEIVSGLYEFGNFVTINTLNSFTDTYTKEGYFARGNYNYLDRYYGSISYRRDASSRFYKDNRWGDFWSFGASWRIDQESFMDAFTWVNTLKLRASYGETGNDDLLDANGNRIYYAYQTLYDNGINNKDEAGSFFSSFGNKDLKWETQVSTDIALEFGLFDRLNGSVEYFQKNSKDLLFSVPTPSSVGVTSIYKNIGKVSNSGVEVNLDYTAFRNTDWTVSVGVNTTFISSTVKSLPDGQDEIIRATKKISVGHSMYDFWLRQYVGVDPQTGNAMYLFDEENQTWNTKDCYEYNGQKVTTTLTKAKYEYSGSSIPKVYGGFNATVRFKGIELSALFSYALGGKILNDNYRVLMNNVYGYAMHSDVNKAWKNPGDITNVPRLDNSMASQFDGVSSRFLMSSDYLSLRSLTLAYDLPKSLLNTIGFKSTRLTLSGENLFQVNAMKGMNAQANFSGSTYNEYVPARTITLGLNVSF